MNKEYIEFIAGPRQNIIQSRYIAAKLANKEQLLLYFRTGKMLSEKIAAEKWGAKVLEQISEDLTSETIQNPIGSSPTTQFPDPWYNISFTHHMLLITKCKSIMGVATYQTTKEVPKEIKGILPDAGELAKLL